MPRPMTPPANSKASAAAYSTNLGAIVDDLGRLIADLALQDADRTREIQAINATQAIVRRLAEERDAARNGTS